MSLSDILTFPQSNTESGSCILAQDSAKSVPSIRSVEIQLRIDILRKIIVFTGDRAKYNFGFDMSLRTRNIIGDDAPILRAVKQLDIETTRKLFQEGFASPFDVDFGGDSLLAICFQSVQNFMLLSKGVNPRFAAFQKIISFLIESGSEWTGCISYLVPDLAKILEPSIQEMLADVVREVIMHARYSPMDTHADGRPGIYLDLKASRGPLGQALLQQDYWMVNWDAQPVIGPNQ